MADIVAATAPTEQSLDLQLEALFGTKESPAPAADKPGEGKDTKTQPGAKPGPAASPDPAAKEAPAAVEGEDPFEKALNDIKDDEPVKEEEAPKPQLSDDQQAVLNAIPTAEVATRMYGVIQNYQNFVGAFEKGEFANVEGMFTSWNPTVYDNFLEYIYNKHMVNGDWAERYIEEAEGGGKQRKGMKGLETKIANLETQLRKEKEQKDQGTERDRQSAENTRVAKAYEDHITGLFDQINFSKADRKWVMSDLNSRVGSDPRVMQAVRSGNMTAINGFFKAAVREYVNRDKQVAAETDDKLKQQNQKKPPISGGGGAASTDILPEDVKQVPKGQEENWMMQELGKLAKKVGLKK